MLALPTTGVWTATERNERNELDTVPKLVGLERLEFVISVF